jgi:hypothetical protein
MLVVLIVSFYSCSCASCHAIAITAILMISVLAFPVVFLLNLEPVMQQIIASLSFAFAGYATIIILFGLKMLTLVYHKSDLGGNLMDTAKKGQIVPSGVEATQSVGAFVSSAAALGKVKKDERVAYIKKQMEEWGALTMKEIEDHCTNSQSKGPRSLPSHVSKSNLNSQFLPVDAT